MKSQPLEFCLGLVIGMTLGLEGGGCFCFVDFFFILLLCVCWFDFILFFFNKNIVLYEIHLVGQQKFQVLDL